MYRATLRRNPGLRRSISSVGSGIPTAIGFIPVDAQSRISRAEAEKIALAKAPNGTVKEGELEKEKGKLIWSFDLTTPDSKDITEVNVDAITGEVVSVEKEAAKEHEKEKGEDAKKEKDKD